MHGFSPIHSGQAPLTPLAQQLSSVLDEIRDRQIRKHAPRGGSDLVERATEAFKAALLETLMAPVEKAPCHLARQYRSKALGRLTGHH